jgi:PhnB protein
LSKVSPIPAGYHNVTPYIVVPGVAKLIDFLTQVFQATERERFSRPDGAIMHAEVKIGDSIVMMGEPPETGESWQVARPAVFHVYIEDVDAAYRRAIQAGATSLREPSNQFYGDRTGGVQDASGNQWWIATHIEDVSREEMQRRATASGH